MALQGRYSDAHLCSPSWTFLPKYWLSEYTLCWGGGDGSWWRLVDTTTRQTEWYRQKLLAGKYCRKKIAKFLMRTFTCRSTFLYASSTSKNVFLWKVQKLCFRPFCVQGNLCADYMSIGICTCEGSIWSCARITWAFGTHVKGTQAWEFFCLWFWILYYFKVS